MKEYAILGDWVEIEGTILKANERTAHLPTDTQGTDYKQWIRGNLLSDKACIGDTVEIETLIDRKVSGKLVKIKPAHPHNFGSVSEELLSVGKELREEMRSL